MNRELFLIMSLLVLGVASYVIERNARGIGAIEIWVIFLFGFVLALAFGVPVLHWLGQVLNAVSQPPGQLGPTKGGGS